MIRTKLLSLAAAAAISLGGAAFAGSAFAGTDIDLGAFGIGSEQGVREQIRFQWGGAGPSREEDRAPSLDEVLRLAGPDAQRRPSRSTPEAIMLMDAEALRRLALEHHLTPEQDAAVGRRGLELDIGGTARLPADQRRDEAEHDCATRQTPGEIARMAQDDLARLDLDRLTQTATTRLSFVPLLVECYPALMHDS